MGILDNVLGRLGSVTSLLKPIADLHLAATGGHMDRAAFYDALRTSQTQLFGTSLSTSRVQGMEGILNAMAEVGDNRNETLAYALATAYHETGARMVPVREGFAPTDEAAIRDVAALARKLGPNSPPARYGKPAGPYGKVYFGRGQMQLTWLENYQGCSADAGTDLVKDPDAMLDPKISARVLIRGLMDGRWNGQHKGIAYYLPTNGQPDLKDARRCVNGTDCWQKIAGYYEAFLAAIKAAGGWKA